MDEQTGVIQGNADPEVSTEQTTEQTENKTVEKSVEQPVEQPANENGFAAARKRAEAEFRKKQTIEQQRMNSEIKKRFGNATNPATGKPIESWQDYLDAFDAQEQMKAKEELETHGVDPSVLERAIAASPALRKAQKSEEMLNALTQQMQEEQGQRELENQIREIGRLNPSVKSFEDLLKQKNFETFDTLVTQNGYSVLDAYKLANFDELAEMKTKAAKQAALNAAAGKNHLSGDGNGTLDSTEGEDIPSADLDKWQEFYPDATMKELKSKYNRALRQLKGG